MPFTPFVIVAAVRSVSTPFPEASTPISFTSSFSINGAKIPIALLPPPTAAII